MLDDPSTWLLVGWWGGWLWEVTHLPLLSLHLCSISHERAVCSVSCLAARCCISGNFERDWRSKGNRLLGNLEIAMDVTWGAGWMLMPVSQIDATGQASGTAHFIQLINVYLWKQSPGTVDNAQIGSQGTCSLHFSGTVCYHLPPLLRK